VGLPSRDEGWHEDKVFGELGGQWDSPKENEQADWRRKGGKRGGAEVLVCQQPSEE